METCFLSIISAQPLAVACSNCLLTVDQFVYLDFSWYFFGARLFHVFLFFPALLGGKLYHWFREFYLFLFWSQDVQLSNKHVYKYRILTLILLKIGSDFSRHLDYCWKSMGEIQRIWRIELLMLGRGARWNIFSTASHSHNLRVKSVQQFYDEWKFDWF